MGYFGLILLTLSFVLGNLYKFSLFSPLVKVSLLDCTVLVITLVSLVNYQKYSGALKQKLWVIKPILAFAAIAVVSLLVSLVKFSPTEVLLGSMYLLRWVTYSLFFVTLVCLFKAQERQKLIYLLAAVTVVTCLIQYLFFPDIRHLQIYNWDPHYYRVVGSWLDPGFTGLLLVFILIYLTIKPLSSKAIHIISWLLTYTVFALTYSRSSYLAYIAGMAWIAWKQKGWKFFVQIMGLFALTLILLPRAPDGEGVKLERTNSILSRIESWDHAWTIFKDNSILGVGFNNFRWAQRDYGYLQQQDWQATHAGAGADSSLLLVAATTGVAGLIVYLWYLKRLTIFNSGSLVFMATLVAVLVHSWFLNSLFYPAILIWLGLVSPLASDAEI